ncbi:indole-3-glycerol phosphate synthase TrpC [Aerococcus sp. NPDC058936]|uniref:indole-3-glycerol phosphate synthase TrpC n=1 Tax=Aerococcus sp. NPDC058936 TaxID=3346674 RepID=UPI00366E0EA6
MSILDEIVLARGKRVAEDKLKTPLEDLLATLPDRHLPPFAFEQALKEEDMSFICEVKKASPSKGLIAKDFPYVDIAKDYQAAGATALSVLTEEDYFQGRNQYLREISQAVAIPILRKDFVIDPYQIYQARAIGADAILLICAILSPDQLAAYITLADELGLSVLVEAHDADEVAMAIEAGSRIIGVNNRNLHNFEVDFQNSIRLRNLTPDDTVFVAESGIKTAADIKLLHDNRVDAVLIGESMMLADDKQAKLSELKGAL